MPKFNEGGTTFQSPLKGKYKLPSQGQEWDSEVFRNSPYTKWDWMEDFDGPIPTFTETAAFVDTASNVDINKFAATAVASVAYIVAPCNGVITQIGFVAEDACVQHATNNITFTGLNKLGSGTGAIAVLSTTAHVNTTDIDATALNGGSDLTAKKFWPLVLSATVRVTKGDVIEITATVAGTPAIVDAPQCAITFQSASPLGTTVVNRTAATPLVQRVANTGCGEATFQLSATNEVNDVFYTWGDQLQVQMNMRPRFSALVKVGAVTTAQTVFIGLGTAFNTTLASVSKYAWIKVNAALTSTAILIEGKDGTTTTTGQVAVPATTLVSGTYYHFQIDFSDTSAVAFYINGNLVGTVNMGALAATDLMQPIVGIKKASGTGTVALTMDYVRVVTDRTLTAA